MHVSLANFIDTLIDYPMSRVYALEVFTRLAELNILQAEQIEKYRLHVDNLDDYAQEEENGGEHSNWTKSILYILKIA